MEETYYAHYRKEDHTYQTLEDHVRNTAELSRDYCSIGLLKKAAWLAGLYHDVGKGRKAWQEYFQKSITDETGNRREKLDHATLGGAAAESMMPDSLLAEMVETVIYNHHGILDSVSVSDGEAQIRKRRNKYPASDVISAVRLANAYAGEIDLQEYWNKAKNDLDELGEQIFALADKGEKTNQYGNKQFFLGMCERMLCSCLIDGDFRDTADFMNGQQTVSGLKDQKLLQAWDQGIQNLESRLNGFAKEERIDRCRAMISQQCREAAVGDGALYRLSVPTGAGKTLSSLRFALYCAKYKKKRHIFYVAPFRSILEQNAEVIRSSLGLEDMVLEHHGDVICEGQEQEERYERLIENWDEIPVIVTTAVQFFHTLFQDRRSNLRRFHSLCNSVVILDEVQSFPVNVIQLFNMAANFLTQIGNTTLVLCSATQPLFDRVRENRLLVPADMVRIPEEYEDVFRRVEYHDDTGQFPNGASAEQISEFVLKKERLYGQVLVIVNTKSCAEALYQSLKDKIEKNLFHLSTNMCAEHRSQILYEIRRKLDQGERLVCISTQLVEAGVDVSFRCVVRSLAGLDNLIQAAGRCNRNGEWQRGHVHLVHLSPVIEDTSKIEDIKKAQNAMRQVLANYHKNPDSFDGRLDSEKAIACYYQYYFYDRQNEMNYVANVSGITTNLVDLLSANQTFARNVKRVYFKQAFHSAGQAFRVIEETAGADVVVPYGEAVDLLEALRTTEDIQKKKRILRRLQRFTVHLSNTWIRKLGDAVSGIEENRILVLADGYYHCDTGVSEHPEKMVFLYL